MRYLLGVANLKLKIEYGREILDHALDKFNRQGREKVKENSGWEIVPPN